MRQRKEIGVTMTPERKQKPAVVSPIPTVVEVENNNVHMSLLKRFGSASPIKLSKAGSKIVSPLAVFQGDGRYFKAQASSSSDQRSYVGDGDSTTGMLILGKNGSIQLRLGIQTRFVLQVEFFL